MKLLSLIKILKYVHIQQTLRGIRLIKVIKLSQKKNILFFYLIVSDWPCTCSWISLMLKTFQSIFYTFKNNKTNNWLNNTWVFSVEEWVSRFHLCHYIRQCNPKQLPVKKYMIRWNGSLSNWCPTARSKLSSEFLILLY